MGHHRHGAVVSGVLGAIAGNGSTYLVVGVASIGGGVFGFQTSGGTINGLTAAQNPPLRTVTITVCQTVNGGGIPFSFQVFGSVSQSFIGRLIVQKTDGTKLALESSTATFSHPGGTETLWSWSGNGTIWDAATTRIVEVQF